jgi:hypothetical protein
MKESSKASKPIFGISTLEWIWFMVSLTFKVIFGEIASRFRNSIGVWLIGFIELGIPTFVVDDSVCPKGTSRRREMYIWSGRRRVKVFIPKTPTFDHTIVDVVYAPATLTHDEDQEYDLTNKFVKVLGPHRDFFGFPPTGEEMLRLKEVEPIEGHILTVSYLSNGEETEIIWDLDKTLFESFSTFTHLQDVPE